MKSVFKVILFAIVISITIILTFRSISKKDKNNTVHLKDNKREILDDFIEKYPYVEINSPVTTQINSGNNLDGLGDFKFYSFKGKIDDTVVNLSFYLYLKDSLFRIDKYSKIFHDKNYKYHLLMGVDTIFFYKVDRNNPENKIFIQGEYNYRFMNKLLTNEEIDYYLQHKDSLSKVKGDDLPILPELDN